MYDLLESTAGECTPRIEATGAIRLGSAVLAVLLMNLI